MCSYFRKKVGKCMDTEVLVWHVRNRYLGRKYSVVVIYFYTCVEKWQNEVKMKTCFMQFSLTSMKRNHTQ